MGVGVDEAPRDDKLIYIRVSLTYPDAGAAYPPEFIDTCRHER
jgi:hypothetical protein